MRFIHTADIHLGKSYRNSPGEAERYEDFFATLGGIVADAVEKKVDFVLIAGDLFHTGQILPKTFARTIETLQPLKAAEARVVPPVVADPQPVLPVVEAEDALLQAEALVVLGPPDPVLLLDPLALLRIPWPRSLAR